MGNTDGLIRLFKTMKAVLLISVPVASTFVFYVFLEGMLGISLFAGFLAFWVVVYEFPSPKEIRRTLKQTDKMLSDDRIVWYVIESREDGNVRVM